MSVNHVVSLTTYFYYMSGQMGDFVQEEKSDVR